MPTSLEPSATALRVAETLAVSLISTPPRASDTSWAVNSAASLPLSRMPRAWRAVRVYCPTGTELPARATEEALPISDRVVTLVPEPL